MSVETEPPKRAGRRGFLRLAAGAAAGGTAVALTGADPAAAATGGALLIGQTNSPTGSADKTTLENPSTTNLMPVALHVVNYTSTLPAPISALRTAVLGVTSDVDAASGHRVGVMGHVTQYSSPDRRGIGVYGQAGVLIPLRPDVPTGVFGFGDEADGVGVHGVGVTGVTGVGVDVVGGNPTESIGVSGLGLTGVVGRSNLTNGIGLRALSTGTGGIGAVVTGASNAVNATSTGATGVSATGVTGVSGTAYDTGDGVTGTSNSGRGVLAISTSGDGVRGASTSGRAVVARSASNIAVSAESQSGLDLDCNGTGRLRVKPQTAAGAPTAGTHLAGELVLDANGDVFVCTAAGTPGTWHQVGAPATVAPTPTGLYRPVDPFRAYDSREAAYAVNGTIAAGANRVIPIKDAHSSTGAVTAADVVPAGAIAITFNLTVVSPSSSAGFLAIAPGTATDVAVSTLNWTSAGVVIANGGTTKIDADRQVKVFVGGLAGAAHVIVDVTGYYV